MNSVPPSEHEAGSECDERDLIDRAKVGDQQALAWLFDEHYSAVYRYLRTRTAHEQDAEDLAQDVFVRMCGAIGRYQHRGVPFRAWLMQVAANLRNDYFRKRSGTAPTFSLDAEQFDKPGDLGPEHAVELQASIEEIGVALGQLTELEREVIRLRYAAELSIAETAAVLGKSENNIKQLTFKALGKLRKVMGQGDVGAG
ncbi:MAG: RNA polymerase sigma factor [Dehalococcoidia bacterium]